MPAAKGSALSRAVKFFREGNADEVRVAFQLIQEEMGKRFKKGPGGRLHEVGGAGGVVKAAGAGAGAKAGVKKAPVKKAAVTVAKKQASASASAPTPQPSPSPSTHTHTSNAPSPTQDHGNVGSASGGNVGSASAA